MFLSLRHGDFGSRMPSSIEADVALVSREAMAEAIEVFLLFSSLFSSLFFSLSPSFPLRCNTWQKLLFPWSKDTCMPFNGARRLSLLEAWRRVFNNCAEVCGWAPDNRNLLDAFVEETLSQVQHRVSRMVGDCAGASILAAFDTSTDQGLQGTARMLSAASGPSSGWVTALPSASSTRLRP